MDDLAPRVQVGIPVRTYTSGEAARLYGISQQMVIRLFDAGHLTGFRLPGSRTRFIPRASLLAFALAHGISTDPLAPFSGAERAEIAAKLGEVAGPLKLTPAARLGILD